PQTTLVKKGFSISGISTPTARLDRIRKSLAARLGRYARERATSRTRDRRVSRTPAEPDRARETVAVETPARWATSLTVGTTGLALPDLFPSHIGWALGLCGP